VRDERGFQAGPTKLEKWGVRKRRLNSKQYNNQSSYVAVANRGQYYMIEIRRERHSLGKEIDWKLINRREHPCVHIHNAKGLGMLAVV
jgi:hypothetical protein